MGPTRSAFFSYVEVCFCLVLMLGGAAISTAQTIKASVVSPSLEPTRFPQWEHDLGYRETNIYPLALSSVGCPFVEAEITGIKLSLMLDTGTARGLVITTNAPTVPHRVEGSEEQLNADGSHRGESLNIRIKKISVLGEAFNDVPGTLADWQMFSSEPFNGTVGLDFFLDRRVTLDYRSRTVATTASPLPQALDHNRYLSADLVDPPKSQGHILYARAKVNGRDAIIYFDTGYNVSFISPEFAEGLARVERPGKFKIFREHVPVQLGGHKFILDELRESPISRGAGFDPPVALVLGSDVLSRFIVTIDIRAKRLILGLAG